MVQAFEFVETDMKSYEGITLSCMEIPTGPDLAWQWVWNSTNDASFSYSFIFPTFRRGRRTGTAIFHIIVSLYHLVGRGRSSIEFTRQAPIQFLITSSQRNVSLFFVKLALCPIYIFYRVVVLRIMMKIFRSHLAW